MRKYESAADRDVLCWIYENQGQCRYGQKCQWLHLDRDTGQYIPTAYIANSLDQCIPVPKKDEEAAAEKTKEQGKDNEEKKEESEDENAETVDELKAKFEALMKKNIAQKLKAESERKVDQNEEDNKEDSKEAPSSSSADSGNKQKESGDKKECPPVPSDKKNYGTYGTTYDRFNVCWEFNTFVGCRKGSKCKWAHQYLAKESAHPYTGEKLNGLAVRKFRRSNDI